MAFVEQSEFMVNFVGGLNTEATSLNYPENAAAEIDNFDLFITGEVKRRLGLDFESGYTITSATTSDSNISDYAIAKSEWRSVNGKGDSNFLVVQIGTMLYFHDLGADPISATLRGSISLGPSKVGPAPERYSLSFAYGEGVLIVGNQDLDPTIVEYDPETGEFSLTRIQIKIRDFEGINENLPSDYRSSQLSADHEYNLRNQGWPKRTWCARDKNGDDGTTYADPVTWSKGYVGVYPANSDVFHAAKMSAADDARSIGTFSPWDMQKIATGNTPAPKGHFILDAFAQDRSAALSADTTPGGTEFGNAPGDIFTVSQSAPSEGSSELSENGYSTQKRPTSIAFYAGRVWFAGVPDRNYTGNVYFSQSLTDLRKAGLCYQDFDPTAEDLNALLATDGGVIHMADLGGVQKMVQVGQDLLVVSTTGVWAISGDTSRGNFTADAFSVRKITVEGCTSRESIVVTEGNLWYWGEGGIWRSQASQLEDSLIVDRVTRGTIQTFYDDISNAAKAYARSFYDPYAKKVYWLYNDSEAYDGISDRFVYNRCLVMDTSLEAFYTYTIGSLDANSPTLAALTVKAPGSESITTYDIFLGDDDIVESSDDIVQDVAFESFNTVQLKALCFVQNEDTTWSYTFGEFKDRGFTDWKTWDQAKNDIDGTGADYTSYIQTGWRNSSDATRNKTITHVTSFFNRTEDGYASVSDGVVEYTNPSGSYVQVRWDYTDLDAGQWTTQQQAYKLQRWYIPDDVADPFDYGYSTIRTKLRMRGRGEAFSIRYDSESGKDMQLLGFAVNVRAGKRS